MQRPSIATLRDLGFRVTGVGARLVGHDADVSVEGRVETVDSCEVRVGQLDRRDLPVAQQRRKLLDAEVTQLFAHAASGAGMERSAGSISRSSSMGNSATAQIGRASCR